MFENGKREAGMGNGKWFMGHRSWMMKRYSIFEDGCRRFHEISLTTKAQRHEGEQRERKKDDQESRMGIEDKDGGK